MKKGLLFLFFICCSAIVVQAQQVQLNAKNFIEINAAQAFISPNEKLQIDKQLNAYDVYEFDLVELQSLVKQQASQATLEFKLPGKNTMEVTIHEHELRAADYRAVAMTEDGEVEIPRGDCPTFKGYTSTGKDVRLTMTNEFIYGFIEANESHYFLKSLAQFTPDANSNIVVFYDMKDFKGDNIACIDTKKTEKKPNNSSDEKIVTGTCHFVEYATDADVEAFNFFGSVAATNAVTLGELNVAEAFYIDEFDLNFRLNFQSVWTIAADPYTTLNGANVTGEVRTEWTTNPARTNVFRDYVIMFSRRQFFNPFQPGNIAGAVFSLSALCFDPDESFAFVSLVDASPLTTTHEIGHSLGGEHEDCDNLGTGVNESFMCPGTFNNTMNISAVNRNNIEGHINTANCLHNGNGAVNTTFESTNIVWNQVTTDNFNWTRDSGGTPSTQTGPSTAYQGNWYFYTEASNNFNRTAQIVSNPYTVCIPNSFLSFGYHMYGSNMGTLSVQVSINNGATWTNVWTRSGDSGDAWLTAAIGLNQFADETILMRITGVTGNSFRSDMAIDDIAVGTNCPLTITPNFIQFPQNGGSQSFTVTGSGSWEAHRPAFGDWATLNRFGNTVTVTAVANPGVPGRMVPVYVSCGPTIYTVTVVQSGTPVNNDPCGPGFSSLPNNLNFESTFLQGWTQDPNDDMNWTRDSGGTPSSGTGPSSAAQGSFYMYTEATSNFNKVANLVSPCFNLDGVPSPSISFSYHMYAATASHMGTLRLQVSQNGGNAWSTIWTKAGNQGNVWIDESISLSSYQNVPIQLRFNATTGPSYRSDITIDDVQVKAGGCFDQYELNETQSTAHATTMGSFISFPDACLSSGDSDYFRMFYSGSGGFTNFYARVTGTSGAQGDYRLSATIVGNTLTVETHPENGSTTNTFLSIYNSSGSLVAQNDNGGTGLFSRVVTNLPSAPVGGSEKRVVSDFDLSNFPNPFNQYTTFAFTLDEASSVSLLITDISGKVLAMPISDMDYASGNHQLEFDASVLAAGVYTYTLKTKDGLKSKQMIIVR